MPVERLFVYDFSFFVFIFSFFVFVVPFFVIDFPFSVFDFSLFVFFERSGDIAAPWVVFSQRWCEADGRRCDFAERFYVFIVPGCDFAAPCVVMAERPGEVAEPSVLPSEPFYESVGWLGEDGFGRKYITMCFNNIAC